MCCDRSFFLTSKLSLYSAGLPAATLNSEDASGGADFPRYVFASCRDAGAGARVVRQRSAGTELTVSSSSSTDYQLAKLPLLVQLQKPGLNTSDALLVRGSFKKTRRRNPDREEVRHRAVVQEGERAPKAARSESTSSRAPGLYSTIARITSGYCPAAASRQNPGQRLREDLFAKVGEGTYPAR